MPLRKDQLQEAELKRLARVKHRSTAVGTPLGEDLVTFFKQTVKKRQTKLSAVAEAWGRLVPETLSEHCSLESLNRGTLAVLVDTSSHLYELRQLLLAGLEKQILIACKSAGLRKIVLKPGRWYEGEAEGRKPQF